MSSLSVDLYSRTLEPGKRGANGLSFAAAGEVVAALAGAGAVAWACALGAVGAKKIAQTAAVRRSSRRNMDGLPRNRLDTSVFTGGVYTGFGG